MKKVKAPDMRERLAARVNTRGLVVCKTCSHYSRMNVPVPKNCPACMKATRRLSDVKAWLKARGEL